MIAIVTKTHDHVGVLLDDYSWLPAAVHMVLLEDAGQIHCIDVHDSPTCKEMQTQSKVWAGRSVL